MAGSGVVGRGDDLVGSDLFVAIALGIDKLLPAVLLDITFDTLAAAVLVSLWNT